MKNTTVRIGIVGGNLGFFPDSLQASIREKLVEAGRRALRENLAAGSASGRGGDRQMPDDAGRDENFLCLPDVGTEMLAVAAMQKRSQAWSSPSPAARADSRSSGRCLAWHQTACSCTHGGGKESRLLLGFQPSWRLSGMRPASYAAIEPRSGHWGEKTVVFSVAA